MTHLISGMMTAGYLVVGLHFLKFHRRSADRLFLLFAIAFLLLAAQRAALTGLAHLEAAAVYLYVMRLVAFVIIIVAIVDKNRPTASRPR